MAGRLNFPLCDLNSNDNKDVTMTNEQNPLGLLGIEFVEFTSPDNTFMHQVFVDFGFSKLHKLKDKAIYHYKQHHINLLLNQEPDSFAADFHASHGPAICSMGWLVENAGFAYENAVARGAKACEEQDLPFPAIYGVGNSLIYFIERASNSNNIYQQHFAPIENPLLAPEKGFIHIDHLTNNVAKGTMEQWANFYKNIFGFSEIRHFDINGVKTGLQSYALRSPDGSFCIPINEGKGDDNNQIDEYLAQYNGPGVQHLAFRTRDILSSLDSLKNTSIETLNIIPEYYEKLFDKFPQLQHEKQRIEGHQVLVDGNETSYLLQIFTKNLFGPIFIEMIQRHNNQGFGEGNFEALFKSIEQDQMNRGVL